MVKQKIRADERRKAEDRLEAMLLAGLQSPVVEVSPTDWKEVRQEALAILKARQQGC